MKTVTVKKYITLLSMVLLLQYNVYGLFILIMLIINEHTLIISSFASVLILIDVLSYAIEN